MNKVKIIWTPKHISHILIKNFYTIYKHNPYTLCLSLTELCHIFVTAMSLHANTLTDHDVALYSKLYGNNTFIFSFFHNRDSLSNQWKDKKITLLTWFMPWSTLLYSRLSQQRDAAFFKICVPGRVFRVQTLTR